MVAQYRPEWSTESGGAGFSVFHAISGLSEITAQAWVEAIQDLFVAVANRLPIGTTISFPSEVLQLNTATGELTAVQSVSPPASVPGGGAGAYSAPSGARLRWSTAGIVGGRRVRGTTFLVPLYGAAYDDAGTIEPATLSQLQAAGETYLSTIPDTPAVYSRPFEGTEENPTPRAGSEHVITECVVPDKAAVLRSRRD
jgi:hypothetical protein